MSAKMAANGIRTHARTNQGHSWPIYMIKIIMAVLEGQLFSRQSEQSEKFSKSPDWLKKAGPPKKQDATYTGYMNIFLHIYVCKKKVSCK